MLALVLREEQDHERLDVSNLWIWMSLRAITLTEPLFWCCFALSLIIPRHYASQDLYLAQVCRVHVAGVPAVRAPQSLQESWLKMR